LWDLSDQLEPEYGKLSIQDVDGSETMVFTEFGLKDLREIIDEGIDHTGSTISSQSFDGIQSSCAPIRITVQLKRRRWRRGLREVNGFRLDPSILMIRQRRRSPS